MLSKLSKVIQFSYRHCLLHQQKKEKKRAVFHTLCHCACAPSRSVMPNSCDPTDCSPPDSSIHGILQARILEWVAISCSRGSSRSRHQTWVSCIAGSLWWTGAGKGASETQGISEWKAEREEQLSTPWGLMTYTKDALERLRITGNRQKPILTVSNFSWILFLGWISYWSQQNKNPGIPGLLEANNHGIWPTPIINQ